MSPPKIFLERVFLMEKKLNGGRDTASKSASQPTKYELHLKASREAEKEERRRRRGFYFDSD